MLTKHTRKSVTKGSEAETCHVKSTQRTPRDGSTEKEKKQLGCSLRRQGEKRNEWD